LKSIGAVATVDYKLPLVDQLAEIVKTTGGKFRRILDTTASSAAAALEILEKGSNVEGEKMFATTDDWSVPSSFPFFTLLPLLILRPLFLSRRFLDPS
jgi:hypothetical protein